MRSIDAACRASDLQPCQELIEIFDLQLGKGKAAFFKVVMEGGQKAFDLSEVVGRRFVRELMEIGVKGIGQIDGSSWNAQRPGNPAIDKKKARYGEQSPRGMLEPAQVRELLQSLGGKHLFPGYLVAGGEAKKVDQDEGILDEGTMGSMDLHGFFPLQVIHDSLHQHPDVFIGHQVPPETLGG
jgi:hypothetical protein